MLCPICKNIALEDKVLENGLKANNCSNCNGNWVRHRDYDEWKNCIVSFVDDSEVGEENAEFDSKKANLCPDCGRILIKYKVSSKLPFVIDNCSGCGGIWFDKSEWELIIKNKLHFQVNSFFTTEWQAKIRKEMTKLRFEENYKKRFGEENYLKLKEIREWIYSDKQKGELIAYLIDADPYKL